MRSLLKISYQHLPFTVHSLVPIKAQNKLNLLVWHGMGQRSVLTCACCGPGISMEEDKSVAWPWESPACTSCSVFGWAALFRVLPECPGCWNDFLPSPKNEDHIYSLYIFIYIVYVFIYSLCVYIYMTTNLQLSNKWDWKVAKHRL